MHIECNARVEKNRVHPSPGIQRLYTIYTRLSGSCLSGLSTELLRLEMHKHMHAASLALCPTLLVHPTMSKMIDALKGEIETSETKAKEEIRSDIYKRQNRYVINDSGICHDSEMSKKRNFLDSYSKEFSGIVKRAKNDDEFHCIPCNEDISLATSGKTSITKHLVTDKHKKVQEQ